MAFRSLLKDKIDKVIKFLIILYRIIFYRIKGFKISFGHAALDAPFGIIGQPNKISWEIKNLVYAKVEYGSNIEILTNNIFSFTTTKSINRFSVSFYGIDRRIDKKFDLFVIDIHKKPPPEPILVRKDNMELETNFALLNLYPYFLLSMSLKLLTHKILIENLISSHFNIQFIPIDLTHLNSQILKTDNEVDIKILTNKLSKNERILPQSFSRPYHEIAMESRWF